MPIRSARVRVKTAKQRSAASSRWLERQLNDPYVQAAKRQGYRSRAAFKLAEMDQRFGLLKPGRKVIDLGSAPGGWVQVALAKGCRVVGIDLLEIPPIEGVPLLIGDIFEDAAVEQLLAALPGPADVLLSDLAPSATGRRMVDRLRTEALAEAVLALAPRLLVPGGHAVIKLLRGIEAGMVASAKQQFARTKLMRPEATRRDSSEIYLVAENFQPKAPD